MTAELNERLATAESLSALRKGRVLTIKQQKEAADERHEAVLQDNAQRITALKHRNEQLKAQVAGMQQELQILSVAQTYTAPDPQHTATTAQLSSQLQATNLWLEQVQQDLAEAVQQYKRQMVELDEASGVIKQLTADLVDAEQCVQQSKAEAAAAAEMVSSAQDKATEQETKIAQLEATVASLSEALRLSDLEVVATRSQLKQLAQMGAPGSTVPGYHTEALQATQAVSGSPMANHCWPTTIGQATWQQGKHHQRKAPGKEN